jgi:zinc protease
MTAIQGYVSARPARLALPAASAAPAPGRPLPRALSAALLAVLAALSALGAPRPAAAQDGIPARPEQIVFPALRYEPPRAETHRVRLKNGLAAYLVPDPGIPMVTIHVLMRVGPDLDPAGREGLAEATMWLLTRGGTAKQGAREVEDRAASLGAQLDSRLGGGGGGMMGFGGVPIGPSESRATVNLLSKDLDEGLALLVECLATPAFEAERLALWKDQQRAAIKSRNDETADIEAREWSVLMRGEGHWTNRWTTEASVAALDASDLRAFHRRWIGPRNFVLAVSGDFERGAMAKALERAFARWPFAAERPAPPPAPAAAAVSGWHLVDKDVNQGRVSIGLRAIDRYDPDYAAVLVMNDILGGGSFSSRLVNRIRSDEGLAYSVRSALESGTWFPDAWRAGFQSKVQSVAYASGIALHEIARMRDSLVTPTELEVSKNKFVETFPTRFETAGAIAGQLAADELTGRRERDPDYWPRFRERIAKVSAEDVRRVARRLLDPSKLCVLVVGNAADMMKGDPKHPEAAITALAGGEPKRLPLRDPLTMKPTPAP